MLEQSKPIAILISDIHFSIPTLEEATAAFIAARNYAFAADIPLVILGDTLDSKAIIRAEVANRLISLMTYRKTYMLVGNHDLINEKDWRNHALNFLRPYCKIADRWCWVEELQSYMIPYMSDQEELKEILAKLPKGSRILMHQGVQGANMGHYVQDKTSLPRECFKDFRVISGHYHQAQDIQCSKHATGQIGWFSYVGNPYTLNFGEAGDPKGYGILREDGTLDRVVLPLRKHVKFELSARELELYHPGKFDPSDLYLVRVTGTREELRKINKNALGMSLFGKVDYKLDLIEDSLGLGTSIKSPQLADQEVLDGLIDSKQYSEEYKSGLRHLWRSLVS